ncbi:MAG: Hsp70 family protein [Alphaproteobacteria bacterium]|nr:Hsp70 family protein [Alphaproteobacteria bacterium]
MRLGIDFGTTRTVVAVCDRGNFPVVGFDGPDDAVVDWWPTVAAVRGDEVLYGWEAAAKLGVRGWSIVRSLKRLLATSGHADTVELGRDRLPVVEVVAGFLSALRRDLLERSNLPVALADDEPIEAMIAVPAGATSAQRFVMLDAFQLAGFKVVGLINEPSAAGIEYAHRYRKTLTSQREDVLVYDLGGGTFDVSLVRMADGDHRVLAHAGDNHLGGDDFDAELLRLAMLAADRDPGSLGEDQRVALLEHCRAQKERLTPNTKKVSVDLDDDRTVTVTTAELYEACEPLVDRSLEAAMRVLPGEGDEALEHLAGVYVVGGASDLPVVARKLKEVFGRRVKRSAYPSASTAVGLAIAFEEAPALTERFSRTFGVFRELRSGEDVAFDVLVTPDAEVGGEGASWIRRYRAAHNVGCFRFAECDRIEDGLPVGDLLPWGEIRFAFDPAAREDAQAPIHRLDGPGPLVEERYRVLPSGIVEVEITDLDSGFSQQYRLGA